MRALIVTVGDCPNDLPFVAPRLPAASFMLPARGKARFASVWNFDDVDYEDRGYDSPRQRTEHSGRAIAEQLLNSPGQGGPSWAERGVFIAEGEKPTEDELKAAERRRDAFRRKLVDGARARFQKDRHTRNITDEAFWAAETMGLMEEWMGLSTNLCPACGAAAPQSAAVCGKCGCILDEKKYADLKFIPSATAATAAAAGRAAR